MNDFNSIMTDLNVKEKKLVEVKNPIEVLGASIDIDDELHKLAWDLKVLTDLELMAGIEEVKLEEDFYRKSLELAENLDTGFLNDLGLVKSQKFDYIKRKLYREKARLNSMINRRKYFSNMIRCYTEWINIYKKTRAREK